MKSKLLSGLLLAIFLFSLASPALAAPSVHGRHLLFGKVTAIKDSTLIVDTWKGEVTVLTDEETRFRIPGVEEPTIKDIEVGDHIIAWGHYDEEGNFTARSITVLSFDLIHHRPRIEPFRWQDRPFPTPRGKPWSRQ